jgi:hypothetical protein
MLCIYRNFCPKREKVTGVLGKLYYDKLCDFDCSGHVAYIWGKNAYRLLVGKPEVSCLFQRLECRWELTIEMNLREIEWEGLGWIHLTHNRDKLWAVVNV